MATLNSARVFDRSTMRGDVFGGVTAAVVALPLALAFGVASGAGAIAGLYGAIACGFFAAWLGGTPAQVSGPTGPMTVVMAAVVAQFSDNLAQAFTIVMLGGALQILFGLMRLGSYVAYTPYSVVSGFMSGIGVIIMLIQTLPFFGLATVPGGPLGAVTSWPQIPGNIVSDALIIALISLGIMVFWPKPWRTYMPPPLAALIIGTLASVLLFTQAPRIGDVPTGLPNLIVPQIDWSALPGVLQAAFILALLGSIDSLLTSLVADSITRTRHDSDRELIGQGTGNLVAGLIGGLPGAGATMRTVVNVRAGGRKPLSGMVHALILLALVLGLGPLAAQVPHAVLAGILMKVGFDIIDWGYLRRIRRAPRDKVAVMLVTLGLTVFVDLITAVAVGIIMASFITARWQQDEQMKGVLVGDDPEALKALQAEERALLRQSHGKVTLTMLRGAFSYASARALSRSLSTVGSGHEAVVYDFSEARHIDTSAAMAIEELFLATSDAGKDVYLSGMDSPAARNLADLAVLDKIPADHRFTHRLDALAAAVRAHDGDVQ